MVGGGGDRSCVCVEGDADYTIGHCPGEFMDDSVHKLKMCETCVSNTIGSTPRPCI